MLWKGNMLPAESSLERDLLICIYNTELWFGNTFYFNLKIATLSDPMGKPLL